MFFQSRNQTLSDKQPGCRLIAVVTGLTLGIAATGLAISPALGQEEPVLNIYNWSDYIAADTIASFEEETGIRVNYDVFDSNEVLEAKLLAGGTGYDIVVPSGSFLERQIQAGIFQPLDKERFTNYGNLDPEILEKVQAHDPDNTYAIPYMWGTTGFAYNTAMIEARMPDAPVNFWDMILDPDVVANFADCGVTLLDAPSEIFETVLNYLGLDPHSQDTEDLAKAEAHLMQIRPHIRYFHSSQNINDLANGEICLAMGWSGDMFIAAERAEEAGQGIEIEYVIPEEGAVIWFDLMAIPADAPHPENAHKFLDYIMRPEVVAEISNYVWYANANAAATELLDEEVRENPAIYPTAEIMDRLFADQVATPRYDRERTRAWTRVKTGQ